MSHDISHFDNIYLNELLSTIGVGIWDWDLATDKVIYSSAWAGILGYSRDELSQTVDTWENMVLPNDLPMANQKIELHLSGKTPIYEAEFRMICKDGSIIWAQDKGQVAEYDTNGKPIRFIGVLQNVTRLKEAELRLLENQETLDLAVGVAELGTWDWDIPGNFIRYNNEYLNMLGYSQDDVDGSIEEWISMNHPEDLPHSSQLLQDYLDGKIPHYECLIRMKHRNGSYIWTRDVGKIVERDDEGVPIRLIGGHLNIDELKRSEERLEEALKSLADNNFYLEQEVSKRTKELEKRTQELVEQDKMLWTVNAISRKLLIFQPNDNFDTIVQDCLRLIGESINKNRIYIWKDRTNADDKICCTQIYEWVFGAEPIQGNADYEEVSYENLPNFASAMDDGHCLNSRICDLSDDEKALLEPQGIKTILIAPISVNGIRWGFIGVDNCEDEMLFNSTEEHMLFMSGSMIANTIEKMEADAKLREIEEHTQMMLDATPLCCNLWSKDLTNIRCNEEAARLFSLSCQQEYLNRFAELSPKYQPCGRLSIELATKYIIQAFEEGSCQFEWVHQKLDGTPIPAEITLVRIKYKDEFIVAGYTRDLREQEAMLAELQSKEDDLRAARDEALISSQAKSNFLANMSHEIRTPMNAISGLAEIILRESPDQQSMEYAKGIKTAAANLLNIINDILDISKIESGKLEMYNSQYELASLLNDVITVSRIRLGSKPLMFITDIDNNLPARLIGDEIRIKQVLINLLSNAIKFTKEGFISLRVWGTPDGENTTLHFSVKDSGIGIKKKDLDKLFAEFERVNTTKNRNIEGTGLGLAISKQLCQMMQGNIEVQSTYGKGSEFIATIPQQCPSYEPLSFVERAKNVLLYEPRERYRISIAESLEKLGCNCVSCANQSDLYDNIGLMPYDYILTAALHLKKVKSLVKKNHLSTSITAFTCYGEIIEDNDVYTIMFPVNCLQLSDLLNGNHPNERFSHGNNIGPSFTAPEAQVLVVDDNPVNLHVATGLMSPYHFSIDTASNGLEAIQMIQDKKYDLVFMDHMMPEMDGIDATVAIRQLKGAYYQNLPIIALTANALVGTREMFIREGMNDFLAKPIEINKLSYILSKWLPQEKIIRAARTEPADKKQQTEDSFDITIPGINTTQGILSVGGSLDNYLQILASYHEDGNKKCVSLLNHMLAKDLMAFRTEVHAMKSTSATIGATEVSSMAAKLETAAQNNDIEFIDANLATFLANLKKILAGINSVLPSHSSTKESAKSKNKSHKGDIENFKEILEQLYNAAELANISQMENLVQQATNFQWPDNLTKGLSAIKESLSMFDYDMVLEHTVELQKLCEQM